MTEPGEGTILDIRAVLDPLTTDAQKLSTFLASLHEAFNAHITVHFNPVPQVRDARPTPRRHCDCHQ